jgi:hypothetical protein
VSDGLPPLSLAELEDWVIEKGDAVIQRRSFYPETVSAEEELVYCLWCIDYAMRNAGDVQPSIDIKSDVLEEGARLSNQLGLRQSEALFRLKSSEIERHYFERFEAISSEIEASYQAMLERHS